MLYRDCMIDFETLSISPHAVVLSLGAVLFNIDGEDTYESIETEPDRQFFEVVEFQSQIDRGRHVRQDTIMWWFDQSRLAQKEAFKENGRTNTHDMLVRFASFLRSGGAEPLLWGNGATFDNVILSSLYEDYELTDLMPKYYFARDLRTLKMLADIDPSADRGVAHSAIDDAKYQVLCAQEYYHEIASLRED